MKRANRRLLTVAVVLALTFAMSNMALAGGEITLTGGTAGWKWTVDPQKGYEACVAVSHGNTDPNTLATALDYLIFTRQRLEYLLNSNWAKTAPADDLSRLQWDYNCAGNEIKNCSRKFWDNGVPMTKSQVDYLSKNIPDATIYTGGLSGKDIGYLQHAAKQAGATGGSTSTLKPVKINVLGEVPKKTEKMAFYVGETGQAQATPIIKAALVSCQQAEMTKGDLSKQVRKLLETKTQDSAPHVNQVPLIKAEIPRPIPKPAGDLNKAHTGNTIVKTGFEFRSATKVSTLSEASPRPVTQTSMATQAAPRIAATAVQAIPRVAGR